MTRRESLSIDAEDLAFVVIADVLLARSVFSEARHEYPETGVMRLRLRERPVHDLERANEGGAVVTIEVRPLQRRDRRTAINVTPNDAIIRARNAFGARVLVVVHGVEAILRRAVAAIALEPFPERPAMVLVTLTVALDRHLFPDVFADIADEQIA